METKQLTRLPSFRNKAAKDMTHEFAQEVLVNQQALILTKAFIRKNIDGAYEALDIGDGKLIDNLPIKVKGEEFSAATIVAKSLEIARRSCEGTIEFMRDIMVLHKMADRLDSLTEIDCHFTKEILGLLQTRSDVVTFRQLKLNANLYVHFLNAEFMTISNRGIEKEYDPKELTTPGDPKQEFFLTVFKLSSVQNTYMNCNEYRGSKINVLSSGTIHSYPTTIKSAKVDSKMVFHRSFGDNTRIHWFFKDGFASRSSRLEMKFLPVNKEHRFSMPDEQWVRVKKEFGFPELTPEYIATVIKGKKRREANVANRT